MRQFVTKVPLEKGWSGAGKFCVTDENGGKYLLKVYPKEKEQGRKYLFSVLKELEKTGISMYRALELSETSEDVSTLYTWVEGTDAGEVLPELSAEEQYRHGMEAGRMLRVIHSVPAPEGLPKWEEYFNGKIDRKMAMYAECPVKFKGAEKMMEYINSNRHLLAGRPTTFQHGDYHVGNMMIDGSGKLVIIDFDSFDFGDPWEEFNRIVWCAQAAPDMARGMVDGYFDGDVPEEFWRLMALYIVTNQLSSVPWAVPFGEGELRKMIGQTQDVLSWYENMENVFPTWYTDTKKKL